MHVLGSIQFPRLIFDQACVLVIPPFLLVWLTLSTLKKGHKEIMLTLTLITST